jgi:hypothetical protein
MLLLLLLCIGLLIARGALPSILDCVVRVWSAAPVVCDIDEPSTRAHRSTLMPSGPISVDLYRLGALTLTMRWMMEWGVA